MKIKGFTSLYPMSRRSNGHPIGVHISYYHDVNNLCIKPLFTIKHEKVSLYINFIPHSKSRIHHTHLQASLNMYCCIWARKTLWQYSTCSMAQSRNQTMYVTLMSHFLENQVFTYGQLQDAGTGQGQGFTWHPTSSIRHWWNLLSVLSQCCCFFFVFFACSAIRFVCWDTCDIINHAKASLPDKLYIYSFLDVRLEIFQHLCQQETHVSSVLTASEPIW